MGRIVHPMPDWLRGDPLALVIAEECYLRGERRRRNGADLPLGRVGEMLRHVGRRIAAGGRADVDPPPTCILCDESVVPTPATVLRLCPPCQASRNRRTAA